MFCIFNVVNASRLCSNRQIVGIRRGSGRRAFFGNSIAQLNGFNRMGALHNSNSPLLIPPIFCAGKKAFPVQFLCGLLWGCWVAQVLVGVNKSHVVSIGCNFKRMRQLLRRFQKVTAIPFEILKVIFNIVLKTLGKRNPQRLAIFKQLGAVT